MLHIFFPQLNLNSQSVMFLSLQFSTYNVVSLCVISPDFLSDEALQGYMQQSRTEMNKLESQVCVAITIHHRSV